MKARLVTLSASCLVVVFCLSAHTAEWKLISQETEQDAERPRGWINQLVIHPTRPDVLYAATEEAGVLASEDGGREWVDRWIPRRVGLTEGSGETSAGAVTGNRVRCLTIDPVNPQVMYAGMAMLGVFKTTDAGISWVEINEMLPDTYARVLAIHLGKPDALHLGTYGGGVYRRVSGASGWEEITEGMRNTYVNALVIDPKDPGIMYVGTNGGVSKTTNGGESWVSKNKGITALYILALAIDPENTGVLYAGTDGGGLFKTEDGGNNWFSVGGDIWMTEMFPGEPMPAVSSVVVNPVNTAIVYAANPSGAFRSADAGENWGQINACLTSTNIRSLAVTSSAPVTVYAGIADGKVFAFVEE